MAKSKVPSFMQKVKKATSKMSDVSGQSKYPEIFFDSGSCIINKIISDNYEGGYPEGRMSMLAGLSNSGKSFLLGNAIKSALDKGYAVFAIDTENALDPVYMKKIGVDVDDPMYMYHGVSTISKATKVLATFFNEYEAAPESERVPVLLAVDSLDELQTDNQEKKAKKGETGGDQGQHAKQLKAFQSTIMHRIKPHPITAICTKQPYMNQDTYTNKREPTVITPSLRFAYSQILLITNKWLKDNLTNTFEGINLEVFGNKTRFSKPFQQCVIEVPYEKGMDWYSGVLQAAEAAGIVKRSGAWYSYGDTKFQRKNFDDHKEAIFKELKAHDSHLDYEVPTEDLAGEG